MKTNRFDKSFRLNALALAALLAVAAHAGAFAASYSSIAAGGDWADPATWSQTTAVPGAGDIVTRLATSGTLYLSGDVSIGALQLGNVAGISTLDLKGYTLTQTKSGYSGFACEIGDTATQPLQLTGRRLLIKNGTFNTKNGVPGICSWGTKGTFMQFSNVQMSEGFWECNGGTRILLDEGTVWTLDRSQAIGAYDIRKLSTYACWCVTGEETRVAMAAYNLDVLSHTSGLYVLDGGTVVCKTLNIGNSYRATNCLACVDSATLTVVDTLNLGSSATANGLAGMGSTLEVRGAAPKVTAETLAVYEKTAAKLAFAVPTDGWQKAPVEVTNLTLVARGETLPVSGDTSIRIACYAWAMAHPETTVPLLSFETADAGAVDEITNTVVWTDYPESSISTGKVPQFSLSADGKTLLLTSPAVNYDPAIQISSSAGATARAKTINMRIVDFGFGSSEITSIVCTCSEDPEYAGATVTNFLAGLPSVSGTAPLDCAYQLAGIVQHHTYYVRITATNDGGRSASAEMTITGDAVTETFTWAAAVNGDWSDPTKWTVGGQSTDSYPFAEDSVTFYGYGNYAIRLTEDTTSKQFNQFSTADKSQLTFDLNGHALTEKGSDNFIIHSWSGGAEGGGDNTNYCGAVVVFRNGTFRKTSASIGVGPLGGDKTTTATIAIEDNATFEASIYWMCNASRLFVRNGSKAQLRADYLMASHTVNLGYPRVIVTGEGAELKMYSSQWLSITVRGNHALALIADGGALKAKDLGIGLDSHIDADRGSVASPDTVVRLYNGTATLTGKIEMGWSANMQCGPRLEMGGADTAVTASGNLVIHEGLAATLAFEIPEAGYKTTPLTVANVSFVAKPSGNTDYGPTTVKLTGLRAWAKARAGESQTLVALTTANAAALEQLRQAATFDWSRLTVSDLSVSDDGKRLVVTAPPRRGAAIVVR